jgi:hypothetical protein
LRMVEPSVQPSHMRRFLPDSMYLIEAAARLLRSADGTGLILLVPSAGAAGTDLSRRVPSAIHLSS